MPVEKKKKQCDYCTFCVRKNNSSGFDKFGHWIPPQFQEYMCARTYRTLGKRSSLYTAPSWCPLQDEER